MTVKRFDGLANNPSAATAESFPSSLTADKRPMPTAKNCLMAAKIHKKRKIKWDYFTGRPEEPKRMRGVWLVCGTAVNACMHSHASAEATDKLRWLSPLPLAFSLQTSNFSVASPLCP